MAYSVDGSPIEFFDEPGENAVILYAFWDWFYRYTGIKIPEKRISNRLEFLLRPRFKDLYGAHRPTILIARSCIYAKD